MSLGKISDSRESPAGASCTMGMSSVDAGLAARVVLGETEFSTVGLQATRDLEFEFKFEAGTHERTSASRSERRRLTAARGGSTRKPGCTL